MSLTIDKILKTCIKFTIPVWRRRVDERSQGLALLPESLVEEDAAGEVLVVGVDLLAELVDELVEAEVDLGLDLVVEVLLAEHGERVVRAVVVQVQRVQNTPERQG